MRAIEAGLDIVFCTGGMSVDRTVKRRLPSKHRGGNDLYGSRFCRERCFYCPITGKVTKVIPICGLPGCAMYNRRTIFDLVLPRLMAADPVTADELASLGEGGTLPELQSVYISELQVLERAGRRCWISSGER